MRIKHITLPAVAAAFIGAAAPAAADTFTIDFDGPNGLGIAVATPPPALPAGVGDQSLGAAILGYYNDDPDYERKGRKAWMTTFTPDALAIGSAEDPNGSGNFPQAHSGLYAAGTEGTSFALSINAGLYITHLSFWYNAGGSGSNPGVALYSMGNLVLTKGLDECTNPSAGYCGWKEVGFSDTDLSGKVITGIAFSGAESKVVFDDITLSTSPIPEPSVHLLLLPGLLVLGIAARRSRRA